MATYTSHLNLKLPDYSDTADIKDLNDNFKKIDDAIASGGTGGGTGGGIVTETDPTVPSWAKQPSKPTYTAAEVGALPDTTVIPTVPSALPNPQPIVINGISYDGSERKEITVDAGDGGSITETDPTVPAWAKAENKPSYTAEEVGALPSTYKPPVTSVNGKTGAVSLVASDVGALPNTTVIPTVPTALKNPYPLTINGVSYDGSEAKTVTIESTGGGASVELDTTLTQYGKAADAGAVGNAIAQETAAREAAVNSLNEANAAQDERLNTLEQAGGIVMVEPADDDIPKLYFTGTTPTSKSEGDVQLFLRYVSKTTRIEKPVTLKVQGDSSAGYPKKNFTMKVYANSAFVEKEKLTFKGWPAMNKFVLKAHWMDHSHVRNVGTAKIWGKIVASRSDYASLPEELRMAANNGATDGFTCKVFVNGVYQGLYELIVPKDKLFGQTTDVPTHSIMNSEQNNQATCAFATTSPTISGNWSEELQDSMSADISTSFANFIKFVAGSTDEEFIANAETYFDVQSVIDFDIFARVFCIVDNVCKNQIFFTYDGSKWYEGAWDMDGVLGNPPTVRGYFAYNTEFQSGYVAYKDNGITNLLYERVETLFMDRFKARYAELRADILSADNIVDVYERLTDVITTYEGLLEEDYASTTGGGAFTGIPYQAENNIQQIRNFVAARLPYMDEQVDAIAPPAEQIPCTGITLDQATLTFTAAGTQTLTVTVTPSNTSDAVVWSSDAPSIASVSNGVVMAKANGSATITATCGAYSATCAVSVSGIEASSGITEGLILSLDSADVDAENMQWPDQSDSGLVFALSNGTPNLTEDGLLMTSCKVVGDKPLTLDGSFSYDVVWVRTGAGADGCLNAFFSFNQKGTTKYCDSIFYKRLRINGYSGDTNTNVDWPDIGVVDRIIVVRGTSGNTIVYHNKEQAGTYSRGTFSASGEYDIVAGASSFDGYPITHSQFRIKSLRIYNRALSPDEVAAL